MADLMKEYKISTIAELPALQGRIYPLSVLAEHYTGTALYYPSDMLFHPLCQLKGHRTGGDGAHVSIRRRHKTVSNAPNIFNQVFIHNRKFFSERIQMNPHCFLPTICKTIVPDLLI